MRKAHGWRRHGPFSCAQWDAFAGEQEAGILQDALQLREHLTVAKGRIAGFFC
jgi:hypothetical protein